MTAKNKTARDFSLEEFCDELGICLATGKNWVRLGKLKFNQNNRINYSTLNKIRKLVASEDNLTLKSRRNKRYASGNRIYNEYILNESKNLKRISELIALITSEKLELSSSLIRSVIINTVEQFGYPEYASYIGEKDEQLTGVYDIKFEYIENEDTLGLIYQSLNNVKNKKAKGAYYTPTEVVKRAVCRDLENKKIFDPCCGTGNFLLQLPRTLDINQIYGNDVDEFAVKIARVNLAMKYQVKDIKQLEKNITCKDFFKVRFEEYDIVVGNPPWGCEFTSKEKEQFKEEFYCAKSKAVEAYDLAVEKAIKIVRDGGKISFVLPEAILNVRTHKRIRELILKECRIRKIAYLGNAFDGVQAPCIILELEKTSEGFSTSGIIIENKDRSFIIETDRAVNSDCFSFYMDDEEYKMISAICESESMVFLKDKALWGMGIVSGGNKGLIYDRPVENSEIILKGTDIKKYKYQEGDNYIIFNPKLYQQVAPDEIYRAKEKLIYKFINKDLVFAYDDKQHVTLNSCNCVIPQIEGMSMKYIMAVLNSDIANMIFQKTYNSVKVLRQHLENIPIPKASREMQEEIIALIDKEDYEKLNEKIKALYGL